MYRKYNINLLKNVKIVVNTKNNNNNNNNNNEDNVVIIALNDIKYFTSVKINEQILNLKLNIDSSDL